MVSEFVSLETLQNIADQYGYWAVFAGIALENAGIPLPGETITLVGGFLAGSGALDYWGVLGCATLGAIVGDNCGYWVGRWQGWPFLLRVGRLFRLQEEQLVEVRDRFSNNAARAVILGRFVALLRIFAGPLAGIAQMPYWKFLLCNAIGAVTWASVMVSLSYFVGQLVPLNQLIAWVSQFALVALGLVVLWFVIPIWLESRKARS
ncbi:MAG: DedA family protein [Oscillatoriales cyanobacterium RM1_1_9]|nr:DedA family protein [Oscillatoriales cyanobacterium SM2_3_0]NJO44704.1 DedA family protein [Oscillatoriales cyanobacterium RM2_1_1]NJO70706.1 DedA family protein [Oscillatoriales cyanobacterium RM1_1_9]